jgi:hypothetical protein
MMSGMDSSVCLIFLNGCDSLSLLFHLYRD